MGELVGAITEILGVYVLHILGRVVINVFTLGRYRAAPYKQAQGEIADSPEFAAKIVSKKETMILGFFTLVFIIVLLALKFTPEGSF